MDIAQVFVVKFRAQASNHEDHRCIQYVKISINFQGVILSCGHGSSICSCKGSQNQRKLCPSKIAVWYKARLLKLKTVRFWFIIEVIWDTLLVGQLFTESNNRWY